MPAFDLSTTRGRLATYLHHIWYDHAYLRLAFSNAHWLSDELVRANQPWPFQVKAWRDRGIRTIVKARCVYGRAGRPWLRVIVKYQFTTPRRPNEGAYDYSTRAHRQVDRRDERVVAAAGRAFAGIAGYTGGRATFHRTILFRFKEPLAARGAMARIRKISFVEECTCEVKEVSRG